MWMQNRHLMELPILSRKAANRVRACMILITAVLLTGHGTADWGDARCDIYAKGEDRASSVQA